MKTKLTQFPRITKKPKIYINSVIKFYFIDKFIYSVSNLKNFITNRLQMSIKVGVRVRPFNKR